MSIARGGSRAGPVSLAATVHHNRRHQDFRASFAIKFTPWDRLSGALDPTYDAMVAKLARPHAKD